MKRLKTRLMAVVAMLACALDWRKQGQLTACNIAEGTHDQGRITLIADAAITGRFTLVIKGTDDAHIAPSTANTDLPKGIATDEAASGGNVNIDLLGATRGTKLVLVGGTVADGDELQSNGDGSAIKLKTTTGTWYSIGRAIKAGVSGDYVEFIPTIPRQVVVP